MTTSCPDLDVVLDLLDRPTPDFESHLTRCVACQEAAQDLAGIRAQARSLPEGSWAVGDPLDVDVEAALRQVLASSACSSGAWGRRRSRNFATQALRLTTAAAALLLVSALGAPYVLRARIEAQPVGVAPPAEGTVFWTTVSAADGLPAGR
jgi:hypothetical protein